MDPISRCAYSEMNDTIEKWTEIVHFVMVKAAVVCGVFLTVLLPYYFYFTTDLGTDAFIMPVYMK